MDLRVGRVWMEGVLRDGCAEVVGVGYGYPPRLVSAGVEGVVGGCLGGLLLVGRSSGWGSAGSLSELGWCGSPLRWAGVGGCARLGGGVGLCVFAVQALYASVELATSDFRFGGCEVG